MARISVEVPDDLSERLSAFAARSHASEADIIRRALQETLESADALAAMIARGQADIAAGDVVAHEDVMTELEAWARQMRAQR